MQSKTIDLIIIPFHDCKKWLKEGFRTRDAHLFEQFQKNPCIRRILVVNRPVSVAEIVVRREKWQTNYGKLVAKEFAWELREITENVFNIDFFDWDFFRVLKEKKGWWFTAFNKKNVIESLQKAMSKLEMKNAVLFLENPMAIGVARHIKFDAFAFDAIDNWLCHPQMELYRAVVEKNYRFVDENANAIFTVSENLKQVFPTNKNVQWVSNGVDVEFFQNAFNEESEKQIVGYAGKIQERVDFDLVENCLKVCPSVEFQFLGPAYSQKERIAELERKYPNIKFFGDIHYSELPKYMKKWNVAIIPHKVDSFTASMNPLKLYEYLAAGKQVVSTGVAGVSKSISPYVYVAANADEFVALLETALNCAGLSPKEIAESIPMEYHWSNRANIISDKLSSLVG
jgi:glycosyltransferase involved in cell wall biosynthesis